jgi:hypothetical protein
VLNARAWDIAKDKACIKMTRSRVEMYRVQFDKLQKATGIETIDQLLEAFENNDDNNFHKFQIVNMLNCDIEELHLAVETLRQEQKILEDAKWHHDAGQVVDGNLQERLVSQTTIRKLNVKLSRVEKRLTELNEKAANQNRAVSNFRSGISKILELLGETNNPLATTSVTESTLIDHLGFVEAKVCHLLDDYMTQRNDYNADAYVSNSFDTTMNEEDRLLSDPMMTLILSAVGSDHDLDRNYDSDSGASDAFNAPFITLTSAKRRFPQDWSRTKCLMRIL